METPVEINADSTRANRLNNLLAISVALLAAFMAVTKVKDDNIVQAMLQAKSDAVDTWGEYQAKRIKHHLVELGRDQTVALRTTAAQNATALDSLVQRYEAEIGRYQEEEAELQMKARAFEAQYDALNYKDDQFDLSDAALSVCLAMLAVAALTRKWWLLWASWLIAAMGVVMGVGGLLGLKLHPDWLTRLLS
jgi:Domain of unknown function (DUF4337)